MERRTFLKNSGAASLLALYGNPAADGKQWAYEGTDSSVDCAHTFPLKGNAMPALVVWLTITIGDGGMKDNATDDEIDELAKKVGLTKESVKYIRNLANSRQPHPDTKVIISEAFKTVAAVFPTIGSADGTYPQGTCPPIGDITAQFGAAGNITPTKTALCDNAKKKAR